MSTETTRDTSTKEIFSPLSADIRLLGSLLGDIIREQHGEEAFELVEKVRYAAKERRADDPNAARMLTETISGLDLNQKRILIKAFSNYFQLINIAEDLQRIRALRAREAEGLVDESLAQAVGALKAAGKSAAEVRALLRSLSTRLVLTAHPSEAKRKEVLIKLRHIAALMYTRDRQVLLKREQAALEASVLEEIEELWQTRPTRASRATVADEVDFGVYFLTSTVMDVVVEIYADLRAALETHYPGENWDDLPPLLRYASWIGGDRDGNPNVTPEVTLQTLATMRQAVKGVYLSELDFLSEHLTHSGDETEVSEELREAFAAAGGLDARFPTEYYRQWINIIRGRLERDEYQSQLELYDDLALAEISLRRNRGRHTARGSLRRLMEKVRLFGLHLAPLDIREDARLHANALDEMFREYGLADKYKALPEAEKQKVLEAELSSARPFFPSEPEFSDATNKIIATWRMVAKAHQDYGTGIIDTFIASMSQKPSDILAMLLLAKEVGIENDIDIVPLFETIDDLHNAPAVMTALFANPHYHQHLKARGNRQQIMIGYSDSGKDGGYLASNWNLYTAQAQLAEICTAAGVALELFHGRGGSIGRGGGPTNQAILAQPAHSMQGCVKITEQGEVIAYRYSNAEIARRHLHQVLHAVIVATGAPPERAVMPEWTAAIEVLAESGRRAYRSFVYETPGFADYWQQATPINELANLPISSRPAKRKGSGGFADVRAIPWVFSWMQSRAILPSWYGVGYALAMFNAEREGGLNLLRTMYAEWPFFKALMENVQLDLAKADMGIAELYASLVTDADLRDRIFGEMKAEYLRSCEQVCLVIDQPALLHKSPVMARSIERRNPYVDPLNFVQVDLLRTLRSMNGDDPQYRFVLRNVLAAINGISSGMKTTG